MFQEKENQAAYKELDQLNKRNCFKLNEINPNKTEIEFYHTNWKAITKEYKVASFCWAMLLNQLKDYLEKGIITPFSERN